jgi:hypothetical protein
MAVSWRDVRTEAVSDLRLGLRQSMEDIAIAKLVVMPFVLTLVVMLGWMLPLPASVAIGLFVLLMVPATLWNAGWRARTNAEPEPVTA